MTATFDLTDRTDTYERTKKLIQSVVTNFVTKYGGDREEMVSIAHEAFLQAIDEYNPERGAFTTKLWWNIWYALMHDKNRRQREQRRFPAAEEYDLQSHPEEKPDHDFSDWLDRLSQDARTVALLTVHSPLEIRQAVGRGQNKRLIRRLLYDLGWCAKRISLSFEEIRRAL